MNLFLVLIALHNLSAAHPPSHLQQPIAAGWSDELNTLTGWAPREGGMKADVYSVTPGAMTIRLPHVPDRFPYTYQWGGVTREASVDLGRYPVLVARVLQVASGSYTHLDVELRNNAGKPVITLRTPTLREPGVIVFDLGDTLGTDVRRLTLRINVGGSLEGANCEYGWVRFVRREDLPRLKLHPNRQDVVIRP